MAASMNASLGSKGSKKLVEFRILHPDQSLYSLKLPYDSTGHDCLDELCEILGIVERDYFGLQYLDDSSQCLIWINRRVEVRKQLKSKPPYQLKFAVRYFTDPDLILQHSTINAIFKDLKYQIKSGELRVPNRRKSLIGATIAQVEFGDVMENVSNMVYPRYFPELDWNGGIVHLISKEQRKLKGLNSHDAKLLFIREASQLDGYGMTYTPGLIDEERVLIGVGPRWILILTRDRRTLNRITLTSLHQVSFYFRQLSFKYKARDSEMNEVEKKVTVAVHNHTVAKSLFRTMTEGQVFYHHSTVMDKLLNQTQIDRHKIWTKFCQKVFRKKPRPRYCYDLQRTKRESYQLYWQLLHQVVSDDAVEQPTPQSQAEIFVNLQVAASREGEHSSGGSNETSDSTHCDKSEVCWGLSSSSYNLAKELLPASQLCQSWSMDFSNLETAKPSSSCMQEPDNSEQPDTTNEYSKCEPLTAAQGKKLQQLLLKIQDERLCNVCMDELISTVFCPCGHYVTCKNCAERLDSCPVCRTTIGYVQGVYTKY